MTSQGGNMTGANSCTATATPATHSAVAAPGSAGWRVIAAEMSNFGSHMVGWKVVVNTKRPSYHTIISVAGNDELVVEGDLTDPVVLAQAWDWFRVITPYTLDSATGEQHEDVWKHHPREGMWAGYRFMPPELASQPGNNQKGSTHRRGTVPRPSMPSRIRLSKQLVCKSGAGQCEQELPA